MFKYTDFRNLLDDRKEDVKNLKNENGGLTCYTDPNNIGLSKGCHCCKSGAWVCVFVTTKCNLTCQWCPQNRPDYPPEKDVEKEYITSEISQSLKTFESGLNFKLDIIKGVSYTGGEPFLVIPKVITLANIVNKLNPEIYQWIYTNGYNVDKDNLKQLKDLNIQEIRFDWVASGFSDKILKKIELASKIIDNVTVEIPMAYTLLSEDFLPKIKPMVNAGVTRLNCAELIIQKNNKERLQDTIPDSQIYTDIEYGITHPYWSRLMTYDIMDYVEENNIKLLVNDCSADAKIVQLQGKNANSLKL